MKLHEIVHQQNTKQLDEVDIKKAISTGALALSTLLAPSTGNTPSPEPISATARDQLDTAVLVNKILKKYRYVNPSLAQRIASLAKKYEKHSFPKAEDILAIIGIESSFDPSKVSPLKKDPAVGLTQIRPAVWDINPSTLKNNIELQVKTGADILHKYYTLLGNRNDAVHAYNVGLGNFRRGNHNIDYVHDYNRELQLYKL
jgi:soluble lytic murein transglycosylase-like protein